VTVSLYWDSHQMCIRLQIGAGICAVPTADAVVTGEVSCHNCVQFDSAKFPALRRRLACEDAPSCWKGRALLFFLFSFVILHTPRH